MYSKTQEKAINQRDKNILVSAAAGSGKTGVLVERIVRLVVDENVSIDKMLIMTFTRNAAAEMKSRIKKGLIDRLNLQNLDLQKAENIENQISLMSNANIQTIDSFCKELVDNYFSRLDNIDPKYRIADEKELKMIKDDVANEILEEKYEDTEYKEFFKLYFNKDDTSIKNMLNVGLQYIYCKAFPYKYISYLKDTWKEKNEKAKKDYLESTIKETRLEVKKYIEGLRDKLNLLDNISVKSKKDEDINIVNKNIERLDEYVRNITKLYIDSNDKKFLQNMISFDEVAPYAYLQGKNDKAPVPFDNGKKKLGAMLDSEDGSEERFKAFKDAYLYFGIKEDSLIRKKINIIKNLDNITDEQVHNKYEILYLDMLKEYFERYEEGKIDKNVIALQDLQKLVLDLLYDFDEKGKEEYSDIARLLSDRYEYIFVDEYQDTSIVQEKILEALTLGFEKKNLFMVGDIKQSIYRFRNADVNIFKNKYEKYKEDSKDKNSENILIELNENYRSSKEVVDTVNYVFEDIMTKESGDIDYDEDSRLRYAKVKKEKDIYEDMDRRTKVYLASDMNIKKEAEIVSEIVKDLHIEDHIPYRDITILLRKEKNAFKYYMDSLEKKDIPVYCEMSSGFYDTYEIQLLIDLLSIIDNPFDDIRLCSLLTSPIYDVSNNELAFIKKEYKNYISKDKKNKFQLEKALRSIIEKYDNNEYDLKSELIQKYDINIEILYKKLMTYIDHMAVFREYAKYKTISEIITIVYDTTNIVNLMANMKGGNIKANNLRLLKEKARVYENTSYVGLYNFIRFLMKIKTNEMDEGIGKLYDENDDIVKITTMHKSKGLQYKVVILPNLDAGYNEKSYKENNKRTNLVCFDDTYGISLNYVDYKNKLEYVTPKRYLIDKNEEIESKCEEKRILYVAMTRAEERLIIVNRYKSEKTMNNNYPDDYVYKKMTGEEIKGANKYKTLICNGLNIAINRNTAEKIVLDKNIVESIVDSEDEDRNIDNINILDYQFKNNAVKDDRFDKKILDKNLSFVDDRLIYTSIKPKISVSSIKEEKIKNEDSDILYDRKDNIDLGIGEDEIRANDIGNMYHKFMEIYDFKDDMNSSLERYVESGLIDSKSKEAIIGDKLLSFEKSEIYKNMKKANENGDLYREKRFMKYIKKGDIDNYKNVKDTYAKDCDIIVQGIIDAFYVEKDEKGNKYIVLIDYKTDGIKYGKISEDILKDRYKVQLDIYKKALEEMTGIKVKYTYIYSFTIDRWILL